MMKLAARLLVFMVIALAVIAPISAQEMLPNTLNVSGAPGGIGRYLVAENGMTLYSWKRDTLNTSNCIDRCAENWPPYIVESADGLTVGEGIPGEIGTTARADGALQVTYNGMPLYYWVNDAAPGDVTGHNVGTTWLVVSPATVYTQRSADLGYILVDANGMTLYTFANDEAGVSNCADQCATNWPPLTVASREALSTSIDIPGIFGTIDRADGTVQVTYNGWPLYTFANDAARGDTTGEGAGDVWFTAHP